MINNSIHCIELLEDAGKAWLEEAAAEIESATKRNSRVKTGQTRGSYEHIVVSSEMTAYVGSNLENAIYEEFGTGEYAINGDGRKGGWNYVDSEGIGHYTTGKKPNQPMTRAITSEKNKCMDRARELLKGKMG